MRRPTRLARILGALCLAGSFALATTGAAHASPPRWSMDVVQLPPQVHTGSDAAYAVSVPMRSESATPTSGKIGAPQPLSTASSPIAARSVASPCVSAMLGVASGCRRVPGMAPA